MLLRLLLIFFTFLIQIPFYSQENYDPFLPLRSYGEIPVSLREDCKFMLFDNTQTPYLSTGKTTEEEIQSVCKSLVSTGKVLFGDLTHDYCKEILSRLIAADPEIHQSVEIYAFKSSYACVVNDGKSTIYISTALIAHADKVEQLSFLIAGQLFHIKNHSQPEFMKLNRTYDYIERLKIIGTYSSETNNKADLYALNSINLLHMNPTYALEALDILSAEDRVIEEAEIPANYLSSELLQFPQSLFDNSAYRFEKIIPSAEQIASSDRKKILEKSELMQTTINSLHELNSSYSGTRTVCTFQYIEDLILENDPEKALYHIMLLENKLYSRYHYLKRMKVHAWLTFIRKSAYPLIGKTTKKRIIQNTQSGRFYIALRRLNLHATETLALRIATDLINEDKDPEIRLLRNYLIEYIREIGGFPISTFHTSTFQDATKNSSEAPATFYLYGISDLVKDSSFVNQMNGIIPVYPTSTYDSILVIDPLAYSFHKQHFKAEKTSEKTSLLQKTIEDQTKERNMNLQLFKTDTNSMSNWVDLYNLRSCYNRLNLQLSNHTQYKTDVFPLSFHQINELTKTYHPDAIGVFHFENQYNINPKGYHLTGLLLIPLPFVGMDLFLGGNHCHYISFLIDQKTGKLNYFENSKYRDPMTKPFIANKIQFSFNHIQPTTK